MKDYPIDMSVKPVIQGFFDDDTNTVSYVVSDPDSGACAVMDSVLDIDYASGRISYENADQIIAYIKKNQLSLDWLVETHVHADHLSAAPYIKDILGGKIGIGRNISVVQETFGKFFNEGTEFQRDGSQFDQLFDDGDQYQIGNISALAIETPGHTPACMVHIIGDAAFVGDTLFMPDGGTARADFPGGNAGELYDSIQKLFALPDEMRLFMCHDYAPNGREIRWETTVEEQKRNNIHIAKNINREQFIEIREQRDQTLGAPRLIIPSLQVNMRAGHIPTDSDGRAVLKVPLNAL